MNHPLTDEICLAIDDNLMIDEDDWQGCMRAGADWQLEQVLNWLRNCRDYDLLYIRDRGSLRRELKKAMRPTTQEDN